MITPADISDAGHALEDYRDSYREGRYGITRYQFDYIGDGSVDDDRTIEPLPAPGTDACEYELADNDSRYGVQIAIAMSTVADMEAVLDGLDADYHHVAEINGFALWEYTREMDRNQYVLAREDVLAYLRFGKEEHEELIDKAAHNLERLMDEPEGPVTLHYEGAGFDEEPVRACPLLDNEGIRNITGSDAAPHASEDFAVISGTEPPGQREQGHMFVRNECSRFEDGERGSERAVFSLEASTFHSGEDAAAVFDELAGRYTFALDGERVSGLGDGAVAAPNDMGASNVDLLVRHGRVLLELSHTPAEGAPTIEEAVDDLGPFAERMIATLDDEGY